MAEPRALVREVEGLFEGRRWGEIEARLRGWAPEALQAEPELTFALAAAEYHRGALADAEVHARAAWVEFQRRGDGRNRLRALNLVAVLRFERGDLVGAEEGFAEVLDEARAAGLDSLAAHAANNLGAVWNLRGVPQRALGFYKLCAPLYRTLGDGVALARAHHNLGIVHRDTGQLAQAAAQFEKAEGDARRAGDPRLAAMALAARADLACRRGDQAVAARMAERALRESARAGDPLGRCDALRVLGAVAAARRSAAGALEHLDEAWDLAHRHGSRLLEAEVLRERGALRRGRGDEQAARSDLAAAASLFAQIGAAHEEARTRRLLEEGGEREA